MNVDVISKRVKIMIHIGLSSFGDHPQLYLPETKPSDRLADYASHYLLVEMDSTYYAIPRIRQVERWVKTTPVKFKFIIKAYRGMTGHLRDDEHYKSKSEMFQAFRDMLEPYKNEGKLAFVLFQFPPWFDYRADHLLYLKYVRQEMNQIPIAIEFRNRTWYDEGNKQEMMQLLNDLNFIHTAADEPQVGDGSVPFVSDVVHQTLFVRLHGRNRAGWYRPKDKETNWREVRYLYRYNTKELTALKDLILNKQSEVKDIYIVFNNNSGKDAHDNAEELKRLLNIEEEGLLPSQLSLF